MKRNIFFNDYRESKSTDILVGAFFIFLITCLYVIESESSLVERYKNKYLTEQSKLKEERGEAERLLSSLKKENLRIAKIEHIVTMESDGHYRDLMLELENSKYDVPKTIAYNKVPKKGGTK